MQIYNFSAGPAMLPEAVMQQAQQEFLNWNHTGCSAMEVSHRSPEFIQLAETMEANLRELMHISDDYAVLFLTGGAQGQFAYIPMHLKASADSASYARTGVWSELAAAEAARFINVRLACDTKQQGYTSIPARAQWQSDADAAYFYYCDNETIDGVEFMSVPQDSAAPLVCDMSSNILSRPIDVSQFGLIFACSQKNLGAAGVTNVIIHKELLARERHYVIPSVFDYQKQLDKQSMYNTAVTYPWYLQSLVLQWLKQHGGPSAMAELATQRSQLLYNYIDQSNFYVNKVDPAYRSRMNIPFHLQDASLNEAFLQQAKQAGLVGLKGHRLVGGMRASMYNAMPLAGAQALVTFMQAFAQSV